MINAVIELFDLFQNCSYLLMLHYVKHQNVSQNKSRNIF